MPVISHRIAGAAAAAVLGAALLSAPVALAQSASPPQAMPAPMSSGGTMSAPTKRSARVEARIKSLHAQLKITPDQESKWSAVADAMRDNAAQIDQLAGDRSAKRSSMSAVDDLTSYEAIADAHADGLKKLVPAFSALYASMSDTQKKNADQIFAHRPATAHRTKASTASHG